MGRLVELDSVLDLLDKTLSGIPDNGIRTRAIKEGIGIAKREMEAYCSQGEAHLLNTISDSYREYPAGGDIITVVNKTLEVCGLDSKYKALADFSVESGWVVGFEFKN
jgi:hypothetical protein